MSQQLSNLNIPIIKNNQQVSFKQNPTPIIQNATTMQGGIPQGLPQSVGDTEIGNRVKNSQEMTQSPYTLPITAGVWYAIAQGMEKFNKKCNGTYDESILGKVTGAADNVSDKITNSSIYKSKPVQWIGKTYNSIKTYINKIASNPKNRLLYSLKNHKTNPECKLVKVPAAGLDGFFSADTRQVFEEFLKPVKQSIQLNQYGISKDVIDSISKLPKAEKLLRLEAEEFKFFGESIDNVNKAINTLSKEQKLSKIQQMMTDLRKPISPKSLAEWAGKSEAELTTILKDLRLQELKITKGLGFDSLKHYAKLTDESYMLKNLPELRNVLQKGNPKLKIIIWKKDGKLNKLINHLFGREVGIQELANKAATTSRTGARTALGRGTGKSFGYLVEGWTNRFGGGKLAVLMQATIFADMLIHTFKAPKGEKGKTLLERLVNDFTYILALPLGIWTMHKAGGLKYLGMTAEKRESWRALQKIFNRDHKLYGSKMYKMRKKVLDRQLMAGVKNPFYKLLKKGANLLTVGIERFKPYVSKSALNMNGWRWFKYGLKNVVGYPLRFAIPMFLLSPMFAKWTTKAENKIFGKPSESVLDENKEEEPKQDENIPGEQTVSVQPPIDSNRYQSDSNLIKKELEKLQLQQNIQQIQAPNEYNSDTNLIKAAMNGEKLETRTYIPSPESNIQPDPNKQQEPLRTYIPNPQGMVTQQSPDMSAYNTAMMQADKTEEYINSVLKSI